MPPRSRATGFDRLAPDLRAAVELVLRQGRSYGELSDLLGMPEETIRARARNGVAALAPDLPAPARSGEIADWLLGQQAEAHAARTREFLLSDPAAHAWAATVAAPLRQVPGGEAVPPLPTGSEPSEPRVNGKTTAPELTAHDLGAPRTAPDLTTRDGGGAPPTGLGGPDAGDGSSRLGGALIIGAAVLLVAAVLAFVFLRGDDDPDPVADAPAATATASATPAAVSNDILLNGPAGSKAFGVMRLVRVNDGTVRFALAAQSVPPNKTGETYSLWFRKKDGSAQLLGNVKDPVGESGELTSAGPANDDVDSFPEWFATYDNVLVTKDAKNAKEPGTVILSGDLPHSASG